MSTYIPNLKVKKNKNFMLSYWEQCLKMAYSWLMYLISFIKAFFFTNNSYLISCIQAFCKRILLFTPTHFEFKNSKKVRNCFTIML